MVDPFEVLALLRFPMVCFENGKTSDQKSGTKITIGTLKQGEAPASSSQGFC